MMLIWPSQTICNHIASHCHFIYSHFYHLPYVSCTMAITFLDSSFLFLCSFKFLHDYSCQIGSLLLALLLGPILSYHNGISKVPHILNNNKTDISSSLCHVTTSEISNIHSSTLHMIYPWVIFMYEDNWNTSK